MNSGPSLLRPRRHLRAHLLNYCACVTTSARTRRQASALAITRRCHDFVLGTKSELREVDNNRGILLLLHPPLIRDSTMTPTAEKSQLAILLVLLLLSIVTFSGGKL